MLNNSTTPKISTDYEYVSEQVTNAATDFITYPVH